MAIDIGSVLAAIDLAKSIAEFVGLLESVEKKVDRLLQSDLRAGMRALEQAARATDEQKHLLREARDHFNTAVNNASDSPSRRVAALLGLALSYKWLGDAANYRAHLEEILEVNPVTILNLVKAEGRKQIGDQVRSLNPFAAHRLIRETTSTFKQEAADKGFFHAYQDALGKNGMFRYGMLIFSERARKDYKKEMVVRAIDMNEEASAIRQIQESVSRHIGKPISWLEELA